MMKKHDLVAACLAAFVLLSSCLVRPETAQGERQAMLRPLPTYPFIRYEENALQFPGGHQPFDTLYQKRRYTKVEPRYYEEVVKGMRQAVLGGTCRGANLPDIEVCGKTGTAENRGHDHSAFMGFAPMDNPKIAIAVYVENGGFGAVYGVPIGKLMIEQYLKGKLSPESEAQASEIQQRRIFYDNQQR